MAVWVGIGNKNFRGKGLLVLTLSLKQLQPPGANRAWLQSISAGRHGGFTQGPGVTGAFSLVG